MTHLDSGKEHRGRLNSWSNQVQRIFHKVFDHRRQSPSERRCAAVPGGACKAMVYTNQELLEACDAARVPGMSYAIYAQVWDAVGRWVHHTVDERGQGVLLPHFVKITWAGSQYQAGRDKPVHDGGGQASATSSPSKRSVHAQGYARRPHVLLSEGFCRQYDVRFRRPAELPEAKCEEINYTKVALKYGHNCETPLTKDLVKEALKRIVSKVGELFQAGADLEITFGVGRLFGRNGQAAFLMESKYVPEGLEMRSAAQGNPFNPLPLLPKRGGPLSKSVFSTPRTLGGRSVPSRPHTQQSRRLNSRAGSDGGGGGVGGGGVGGSSVSRPPTASPADAAKALRMLVVNKKEGVESSLRSNLALPPLAEADAGGEASPAGAEAASPVKLINQSMNHSPAKIASQDRRDQTHEAMVTEDGRKGGEAGEGTTFLLTAVPEVRPRELSVHLPDFASRCACGHTCTPMHVHAYTCVCKCIEWAPAWLAGQGGRAAAGFPPKTKQRGRGAARHRRPLQ